jgi:hypothetical protein
LREELRREAAAARTYDVYAGSLRQARRGRRRAAAVWAMLVAVVALAVPLTLQPAGPEPDGGAVTLPDRLALPAFGSRGVGGLGAASAVFSGYGGRFGPWFDENDTYALVGATAEDYRTIRSPYAYDQVKLSPDGTLLALPDRLVELRTGAERPLPGLPLAWSPDGTRIAIAADRVRIIDVTGGAGTDLGPLDQESAAAWSPDGSRLAFEAGDRVEVREATGRTVTTFGLPSGARLLGKGAWTPDGRAVAVTDSDRAWEPRWFDPATGQEVTGPALPAIDGEIFGGGILGWRPDGTALAFIDAHQPRLLALTPGAAQPVPAMILPGQLNYLDLTEQVMRSGGVREGDAPFLIGPRLWLKLSVTALGAVAVLLVARRLHERARKRRVAATPWETTHGPLV